MHALGEPEALSLGFSRADTGRRPRHVPPVRTICTYLYVPVRTSRGTSLLPLLLVPVLPSIFHIKIPATLVTILFTLAHS